MSNPNPNEEVWALAVPGKNIQLGRGRLAGIQAFEKSLADVLGETNTTYFRGNSVIREFVEGTRDYVHRDEHKIRLSIVTLP